MLNGSSRRPSCWPSNRACAPQPQLTAWVLIAVVLVSLILVGLAGVQRCGRGNTLAAGLPEHARTIQPTPYPAYNDGGILDFPISGDFSVDENISIFVNGYELEWPWHSFHCTFDFGQNSSGTATFEGRAAGQPGGERVIQCPMPAAVIAAVRSGSLRTIGFSIFESRNSTAAIIDGVNLALYPKQYFDSAIHTMIKNVGGELPQWIEYHRLLGVQHFYLFDNNSTDGTRAILERYVRSGVVTLVHWPYPRLHGREWVSVQRAAMNHFLRNWGRFTRWVGMFDVDEYLQLSDKYADRVQRGNGTIAQLLDEAFPGGAAVQLPTFDLGCRLPGSQGEMRKLHYMFLLEICNIDLKAARRPPAGSSKLWMRPSHVHTMISIHTLLDVDMHPAANTSFFAHLRHYHFGSHDKKDGQVDHSMDRWIAPLHDVCDRQGC